MEISTGNERKGGQSGKAVIRANDSRSFKCRVYILRHKLSSASTTLRPHHIRNSANHHLSPHGTAQLYLFCLGRALHFPTAGTCAWLAVPCGAFIIICRWLVDCYMTTGNSLRQQQSVFPKRKREDCSRTGATICSSNRVSREALNSQLYRSFRRRSIVPFILDQ